MNKYLFYTKDKDLFNLISNKRNHYLFLYIIGGRIQDYIKRYNIKENDSKFYLTLVYNFMAYMNNVKYSDLLAIEQDQNFIYNLSMDFLIK